MTVSRQISGRAAALEFLLGRIDYERTGVVPYRERDFKLDRMQELAARLGRPQDALQLVHVAGTKGKGSTSAMIAAALSESGYRTGLYLSPHLDRLEERFVVDGLPCQPSELVDLVGRVRDVVARMESESGACPGESGPTYFDITTAMALLHFVRREVDVALLEVGLGGRLDSTNICLPLVSVITSISRDHTQQLGHTLREIATEKAGVVKPGVPVISGVTEEEPRTVIERAAQRNGCRLVQAGRDFCFAYRPPRAAGDRGAPDNALPDPCGTIDYTYASGSARRDYRDLRIGLTGRHQGANAAVALTVVELLREQKWSIDDRAVRRGLARVTCPARVELMAVRPTVIVDGAHNPASVAALVDALADTRPPSPPGNGPPAATGDIPRLLVFATSQDKDAPAMLRLLLPHFDRILFTRYVSNPRSTCPADLVRIARELVAETGAESPGCGNGHGRPAAAEDRFRVCADPAAVLRELQSAATPRHVICVTGSFFIAAEMRRLLQQHPLGVPPPR